MSTFLVPNPESLHPLPQALNSQPYLLPAGTANIVVEAVPDPPLLLVHPAHCDEDAWVELLNPNPRHTSFPISKSQSPNFEPHLPNPKDRTPKHKTQAPNIRYQPPNPTANAPKQVELEIVARSEDEDGSEGCAVSLSGMEEGAHFRQRERRSGRTVDLAVFDGRVAFPCEDLLDRILEFLPAPDRCFQFPTVTPGKGGSRFL